MRRLGAVDEEARVVRRRQVLPCALRELPVAQRRVVVELQRREQRRVHVDREQAEQPIEVDVGGLAEVAIDRVAEAVAELALRDLHAHFERDVGAQEPHWSMCSLKLREIGTDGICC